MYCSNGRYYHWGKQGEEVQEGNLLLAYFGNYISSFLRVKLFQKIKFLFLKHIQLCYMVLTWGEKEG